MVGAIPANPAISRSRPFHGPGHAIATDAAVLDHYRQWLQIMPFRAAENSRERSDNVGQFPTQQDIKVKPGDHHRRW